MLRRLLTSHVVVAALFFSITLPVQASTNWILSQGQSGDWSNSSNWDNGVPTSNSNAYVVNGGTVTISQSDGRSGIYLYLGGSDTGTVQMTGGQLSTAASYIGYQGIGAFIQSSGNHYATDLYLGYTSEGSGSYKLSGNGVLSTSHEFIGCTGSGTFTQTGGTNYAAYIQIGSQGVYTFSAGTMTLTSGLMNQGVWDLSNSTASLNANGAIVDLSQATLFNSQSLSLSLSQNLLLIVPSGFDPTTYFTNYHNFGLVHQAGSTFTLTSSNIVNGTANIGDYTDCRGTLSATSGSFINLSGGVGVAAWGKVSLGSGTVTANGTLSYISGGTLSAAGVYVGSTGAGTLTHTGGTNSTSGLYLGRYVGDSGTYLLSGAGTLNATDEYVGYSGSGLLTQTGGSNTVPTSHALYIGYDSSGTGTYRLDGVATLSAATEYVGYSGVGGFVQSIGTNAISGTLSLGHNAGGSGTYQLSETGVLTAPIEYIGYSGSGTVSQSGGRNTVSSYPLYLGYSLNSSGTYQLSGTGLLSSRPIRRLFGLGNLHAKRRKQFSGGGYLSRLQCNWLGNLSAGRRQPFDVCQRIRWLFRFGVLHADRRKQHDVAQPLSGRLDHRQRKL